VVGCFLWLLCDFFISKQGASFMGIAFVLQEFFFVVVVVFCDRQESAFGAKAVEGAGGSDAAKRGRGGSEKCRVSGEHPSVHACGMGKFTNAGKKMKHGNPATRMSRHHGLSSRRMPW
jgi:hypothetical protein